MAQRGLLVTAAILGLTAVIIGAFGAHTLRNIISRESLETFEIAVRYQFYHALALLAITPVLGRISKPVAIWVPRFWISGVLLFSGSLYLLSIFRVHWIGIITPVGGIAFLIGWALLTYGFFLVPDEEMD